MSYSLNSLNGDTYGDYIWGPTIGAIKGDTRSLDYGSQVVSKNMLFLGSLQ